MITGTVNYRREAVLTLRVRGPGGVELDVLAVVDTAFTGSLTLPPATVAALGLAVTSRQQTTLAGGVTQTFGISTVEVLWDGVFVVAPVFEAGGVPLVGMGLLAGYELRVEVTPGGVVEVRLLSAPALLP